jgi:hypothetical protein
MPSHFSVFEFYLSMLQIIVFLMLNWLQLGQYLGDNKEIGLEAPAQQQFCLTRNCDKS